MMNSGLSLIDAIHVINVNTKDILTKRILSEVERSMEKGEDFSIALEKYVTDYATIAYVKSGEKTNQIENSLGMIIAHNEHLHEKSIARMVVWLPLVGEIIMTIVLLWPLIDILKVTTIGAMNFTI